MFTVYTFLLAVFLSTTLVPLLARIAPSVGLVDRPDSRKIHQGVIPRIGGIAIIIGMFVPVLLWVPLRPDVQGYLAATALLAVFGILDDRHDLDYRVKFLSQIAAALIVVVYGSVEIRHFPFLPEHALPQWLSISITVLALVAITNAINLSDGLDGLAGGTSLLVAGFLGLLAFQAGDNIAVMLALAIAGGTIGFLRYNTHPAWVFMGDCGSQFLGFSTGVLALMVTQKSNPTLSPMLPLLFFGLPILDTIWVMMRRISEGRSPFSPDRGHIHHRLLDLGLTQYESVVLIYGIQIALILTAYFLTYSWDLLVFGVFSGFVILVVLSILLAERRPELFSFNGDHHSPSIITQLVTLAKNRGLLCKVPYRIISLLVPTMLVAGSFLASEVDKNVAYFSLALIGVLLLDLWVTPDRFFSLERLTTFSAIASVVYLFEIPGSFAIEQQMHVYLLFLALAFLVGLWIRFSSGKFQFNSMDFLIVVIVFVVPNLPEFGQSRLGIVAIEMMVLFYASEMLFTGREQRWDLLRIGVLITLSVLSLRGFEII
jgi:UDP-GlcNAc:undecaprenyl-phosphate GlcNAc-1-phosphate transferase